ncbi:MAG TPA: aldo/keto reductase, partial [Burkholderiales bacterium]|nr:aldo/keto reductase [Burkholderiales bacterium]
MDYRTLGRTGVKVSPLCLGAMMFGAPTSEQDSIAIVERALEAGINFFDVADGYNNGEAERILGRALKGRRDRVVLATKFGVSMGEGPNDVGASRYHLMHALHASLRRLDTDCIDVYYIHKFDYATPLEETLRALDDCVRAGKVRYIACSNFYAWRLVEGLDISRSRGLTQFACVQPLYNIVNRDPELELLPACVQNGLGVVSYSPLARGVLSGKYAPGAAPPEGSRAARGDKRIQQTELREESFAVAQ